MTSTLDYYNQLIALFRLHADKNGIISYLPPGTSEKLPVTVEGKKLTLPLDKYANVGFKEDQIAFHPLSENIARKNASPVMQFLQRTAKANLAFTVSELMIKLLEIASDVEKHKDIPPSCAKFFKKVPNADKQTVTLLKQILKKAIKTNKFFILYLKNGGKLNGVMYNKVTMFHFVLAEEIKNSTGEVLGITVSKQRLATLKALVEFILPKGDNVETYSAGSKSRIAPYFESFVEAYTNVASVLQKSITDFCMPMDLDLESFENLDEIKDFKDFGDIYDEIPALNGNQGDNAEAKQEDVVKSKEQTWQETVGGGTTSPVPQPKVNNGKVSVDDYLKMGNQFNANTYVQPLPVQQAPMGNGFFNVGQPQPQQMMQPHNPFAAAFAPTQQTVAQPQYGYSIAQQPVNPGYGYNGGGTGLL